MSQHSRSECGCPNTNQLTILRGALEPQFFAALLQGLSLDPSSLPGPRDDKATWPWLRQRFTQIFKSKTRDQWEAIFDGTDACAVPVKTQSELEVQGYQQRPIVTLARSPGLAIAADSGPSTSDAVRGQGPGDLGQGWTSSGLKPGHGGDEVLSAWLGWTEGRDYSRRDGGLVRSASKL